MDIAPAPLSSNLETTISTSIGKIIGTLVGNTNANTITSKLNELTKLFTSNAGAISAAKKTAEEAAAAAAADAKKPAEAAKDNKFTSLLKSDDIGALNAAIDETTVDADVTRYDTYTDTHSIPNNLSKYYTLIKPRLATFFSGCYDSNVNDITTLRIIFALLRGRGAKHIENINEYKDLFETFEATVIADDGPCEKPIDVSKRNVGAGVHFTTEIEFNSRRITKTFMKHKNKGNGDCLFYTLLDLIERANPEKYKLLSGDNTDKMMQLRNEIVDYVIGHRDINYDGIGTTFEDMLTKKGIETEKSVFLFEKEDTPAAQKYSVRMKVQGTWGTEVEISAAAKLYGINIYVLLSNGKDMQFFSDKPDYDLKKLWYIFNYNLTHYEAVWCLDGDGKCPPNSGAPAGSAAAGSAAAGSAAADKKTGGAFIPGDYFTDGSVVHTVYKLKPVSGNDKKVTIVAAKIAVNKVYKRDTANINIPDNIGQTGAIVNASNTKCNDDRDTDGKWNITGVNLAISMNQGKAFTNKRNALILTGDVRCPTGEARLTEVTIDEIKNDPTFKLNTLTVIHATGPNYSGMGERKDSEAFTSHDNKLLEAYGGALNLAKARKLTSIAFSLLSSSEFKGELPLSHVLGLGVNAIITHDDYGSVKTIILCAFKDDEYAELLKLMNESGNLDKKV